MAIDHEANSMTQPPQREFVLYHPILVKVRMAYGTGLTILTALI